MSPTSPPAFPAVVEPFLRTLARNTTIAAVVAAVIAAVRGDRGLLLPVAILAMWFSLGGHYVELAFLNVIRNRVPKSRVVQTLTRLLVWSCGGAILYGCMAASARILGLGVALSKPWWFGSLVFTGIELAVHTALALRRVPNFYDGRG